MDGIIPLYKERGMTSFDCIRRLRSLLKTKKIGHSGTLDPSVDGVLPICVGNATKVVPYLMASGKVYQGELLIGKATETEDLDGAVIETAIVPHAIKSVTIQNEMNKLTGQVRQQPPMYSAVKVHGKRLYEYARAGETVERPVRTVQVDSFQLLRTKYDDKSQTQRVTFRVACGKGTYIRTLVVALARQLGFPGTMSSLTRIKSGGFTLEDTLSLDDVQNALANQILSKLIYPLDAVFSDYAHVTLTTDQWHYMQHGSWFKKSELDTDAETVALVYNNQVKAIYHIDADGQNYKPQTMLRLN